MAAPTFVAEHETTWNSETPNPRVTAAFNALAGDLLVCIGMSEDQAYPLATPTNTQGALTWTLRQSVVVSAYSTCYVWTAPVDANKTGMTVSVSRTSNGYHGINVLHFRDTAGVGASAKANASGAPSVGLTTGAADSAVVVAVADWNAVSGASRTWRTVGTAATEQSYEANGHYTLYAAYHANAGAAGAKTAGLSAPTGQKYAIIAVEILGAASEEVPTGSASGTITISGTAVGSTTRTGVASGSIGVTGTAAGATTRAGAAAGTVAVSGTASGTTTRQGSAAGQLLLTSTAAGQSTRTGQAAATTDLSGTALGVTIRTGTATSLITITGTAEGRAPSDVPVGSASSLITISGTATGTTTRTGTAVGVTTLTALAAGESDRSGSATSLITITGTARGHTPGPDDGLPLVITSTRLWSATATIRTIHVHTERLWEAHGVLPH